ncbi:hypothetical protein H5T58_03010, partial [Candidatus Parcubacteria bacterium]|nr:hypothetical protein [Candidatus Parcubacteria bacterium]
MKKRNSLILVCFLVILPLFSVKASFIEQINYQGKLTDLNGIAVPDGGKCFRFKIFDAETEGNEIWSETWASSTSFVTTTSGYFSVMLGTHNSLSGVNFYQPLFLEVQFDPDCDGNFEEIFSPRKKLGAVASAFETKRLAGFSWESPGQIGIQNPNLGVFSNLSSLATTVLATVSGNVGIGLENPLYKLDVNGDLRVSGGTIFGGVRYTWPSTPGNAGQVLTTDGSGNLTWTAASGGIGGSIEAGRIAFGVDTNTIGGEDALFWDTQNKKLRINSLLFLSGNLIEALGDLAIKFNYQLGFSLQSSTNSEEFLKILPSGELILSSKRGSDLRLEASSGKVKLGLGNTLYVDNLALGEGKIIGITPIFGFSFPVQTASTQFVKIPLEVQNYPFPSPTTGNRRVHKVIFYYAASTTSPIPW